MSNGRVSFSVESVVRGYYAYKDIWAAVYGEELPCEREAGNRVDAFAVAVMKDGTDVGHIPKKSSSVCSLYLRQTAARLACIEAYSPIMACCVAVYYVYVPLDFEVGVKALSLTASLAAFIVAGFTEDERCPVGEGRRLSDGLK